MSNKINLLILLLSNFGTSLFPALEEGALVQSPSNHALTRKFMVLDSLIWLHQLVPSNMLFHIWDMC